MIFLCVTKWTHVSNNISNKSIVNNTTLFVTDGHVLLIKKIHVKGVNKPQLMAVGGVKINRGERIQVNDSTLIITRALPRDAGTYICSFQTMPSVTLNHSIDVQFAPTIKTTSNTHNRISHGGEVYLSCAAEGNPQPKIRWSRQDGPMPNHSISQEVRSSG